MTEMFIVEQHRLPKAFKRQDVQPKTKFVIFSLMMLHISCTIAGDYSLMSQGQIQRGGGGGSLEGQDLWYTQNFKKREKTSRTCVYSSTVTQTLPFPNYYFPGIMA